MQAGPISAHDGGQERREHTSSQAEPNPSPSLPAGPAPALPAHGKRPLLSPGAVSEALALGMMQRKREKHPSANPA